MKMKKLLALMTVAAMTMSMGTVAFAETETEAGTEATDSEIMVLTFDETAASFEGTWIPFEAGFQIYLPSDWDVAEISDEDAKEGLLFQAGNTDGWNVAVTATEVGTEYDIPGLIEELSASYSNVAEAYINDIDVVTYDADDADSSGIAFLDDAGVMYVVNCSPVSDEDFQPVALDIFSSLSITE